MSSITPGVGSLCQAVKSEVDSTMNQYDQEFEASNSKEKDSAKIDEHLVQKRLEKAETLTEGFYILVRDFYEYGWGQSFHFAPQYDG